MDPIISVLPSVGLKLTDVALGDIGTAAVLGGVLFEAIVRLAPLVGWRPSIDGWREGMFFGALVAFLVWIIEVLEGVA